MNSSGFNKIRAAKLNWERVMEDELRAVGWHKGWRKKNNMTYWVKEFDKEGVVTASSLEDALLWEFEL